MRKLNASITVFFSLLSVVFLAFTFTIVEAVRISGARAQCTDLAAIANWTLFSEYENGLLEKYDLFGIDTGFDSGTFSTDYLISKLKASMLENTAFRDRSSHRKIHTERRNATCRQSCII